MGKTNVYCYQFSATFRIMTIKRQWKLEITSLHGEIPQEACVSEFPSLPHFFLFFLFLFASKASFLFILHVKGEKSKHRKCLFVSDSSCYLNQAAHHVTKRETVVAFCPYRFSTRMDVLWYMFLAGPRV